MPNVKGHLPVGLTVFWSNRKMHQR